MFDHNYMKKRYEVENTEKWREIAKQIPYLKFNPEWQVAVIPPFAGVTARFLVKYKTASVSVYLDWYSALGSVYKPYWEIYPYKGDIKRYLLDDTKSLTRGIQSSINFQLKNLKQRK